MKLKDKLMLEKIKLKNLQPDLSRNRGRKLRSIKLEMNTLSKLNQEETENMNRPVTSNENEPVMKTLPAGLPSWHNG